MTDDDQLRREIAADLLHAIRFALMQNADLESLASSKIIRVIASSEIERRRLAALPKGEPERMTQSRLRLMKRALGR